MMALIVAWLMQYLRMIPLLLLLCIMGALLQIIPLRTKLDIYKVLGTILKQTALPRRFLTAMVSISKIEKFGQLCPMTALRAVCVYHTGLIQVSMHTAGLWEHRSCTTMLECSKRPLQFLVVSTKVGQ